MILAIVESLTIIVTVFVLILFKKKNKNGWLLSISTNMMWFYIGIVRRIPVIIIATAIYFVFNILGYLEWRKQEEK